MFFLASKDYSRVSSSTTSLHSGAHSFLPDQNLMSESDQSSVDCCKMLDMFDNKTLKVKSTRETLFLRLKCVCVCVRVRGALQNRQAKYSLSFGASKRSNTHTICKNGRLGEYSLKTQFIS